MAQESNHDGGNVDGQVRDGGISKETLAERRSKRDMKNIVMPHLAAPLPPDVENMLLDRFAYASVPENELGPQSPRVGDWGTAIVMNDIWPVQRDFYITRESESAHEGFMPGEPTELPGVMITNDDGDYEFHSLIEVSRKGIALNLEMPRVTGRAVLDLEETVASASQVYLLDPPLDDDTERLRITHVVKSVVTGDGSSKIEERTHAAQYVSATAKCELEVYTAPYNVSDRTVLESIGYAVVDSPDQLHALTAGEQRVLDDMERMNRIEESIARARELAGSLPACAKWMDDLHYDDCGWELIVALNHVGEELKRAGRPEDALEVFQCCIDVDEYRPYRMYIAFPVIQSAIILRKLKRREEERDLLERWLEDCGDMRNSDRCAEVAERLRKIYARAAGKGRA
ncbi:hypothetical protein [Bifidobacterium catulorum]|uniref:Tetratricopeptide repeat protein n=1 Tax=Bifidobacterium catulorum TaxID=1630173 RepID=A0A2U2MTX6_9BIFI|nr:hypothetical protein [Bifidobacterium catulorum]PWG60286.1 hypothetical protein DF200_03545 [Bifidobacterium catulorum]